MLIFKVTIIFGIRIRKQIINTVLNKQCTGQGAA